MRHLIVFFFGLVAGIVAAIFGQQYLQPKLPSLLGGPAELETRVAKKLREPERLLLTVETPNQVVLATFTDRIEEIDMLVALGDFVTLRMSDDQPFVSNPHLARVRKPGPDDPATPAIDDTSPDGTSTSPASEPDSGTVGDAPDPEASPEPTTAPATPQVETESFEGGGSAEGDLAGSDAVS